mmetsp:Transcript_40327/g.68784  ORF Transcript_40327/g.68784 Transcript_40327/m.68784 type:complete len:411 (-) Transcript_40327:114-1346(-)
MKMLSRKNLAKATALLIPFAAGLLLFVSTADKSPSLRRNSDPTRRRLFGMGSLNFFDPKSVDLKDAGTFYSKIYDDKWKVELFERLDRVRAMCGGLCAINTAQQVAATARYGARGDSINTNGANFPTVRMDVNCPNMLTMSEADAGDTTVPYPPPEELNEYYSLNGAIPLELKKRWTDIYLEGEALVNVWSKELIDSQIEAAGKGTLEGSYKYIVACMIDKLRRHLDLKGKSVLVIGSERPWVEVICLYLGAAKVTTLEYGKIETDHPQLQTMVPEEFRRRAAEGTLEQFDGILSHSSLEHSGLGRYGDALNPWGDIIAAARGWCVTKEDGFMVLGLPTGKDKIHFNANRVYGKIRWPLVAANWYQIDGADHRDTEFLEGEQKLEGDNGCGGGQIFIFRKAAEMIPIEGA